MVVLLEFRRFIVLIWIRRPVIPGDQGRGVHVIGVTAGNRQNWKELHFNYAVSNN
jgi:hypothetical protein